MNGVTIIAGIHIPSTSSLFLAVVGIHVLFGLTCTITGIVAMLSVKRTRMAPEFRHDLLLVPIGSFWNRYRLIGSSLAG
jgi:hypothetical protein